MSNSGSPSGSPEQKMLRLDVRWLYLVLGVVIMLPLLRPIGLPINITEPTKKAFAKVDSLPEGSVVLECLDIAPSNEAENWPQAIAVVKHSVAKKHRLLLMTTVPEGVMYAEKLWNQVAKPAGYELGKDIVILPFRAGSETAIASLGEDLRGLYQADYYGKPLSSLPLMQSVNSIKDVALVNAFTAGDTGLWFIRQVEAKFHVPLNVGCVAVGINVYGPFYTSGQSQGLLLGQAGAAEYETMLKAPGKGVAAMDAQSTGHLFMVLLIVVSNVLFFFSRKRAALGMR